MAICKTCGVDIGNEEICPLCHKPINSEHNSSEPSKNVFEKNLVPISAEKRLQIFEVLSVSILIAAVAVIIVNVVIEGRLTWSWYPLISLVLIWILSGSTVLLSHKPWLVACIDVVGLSAFLYVLDVLTGPAVWFWRLALPMIGGLIVALAIVLVAYAIAKRKGLNIIGWIMLAIAEFCIAIEASISIYTKNEIKLFWSSITASALIPVALFLFYIHYRVAKSVTLKKLFHL